MRRPVSVAVATAAAVALSAAPAWADPPVNDAFESPTATSGTIVGQLSEEATRQAGEPSHGGQSVWYTWQAPSAGRFALERVSGDANAALYTGDSLSTIRRAGAPDDDVPRIPFEAVAGTVYRIAVTSTYEGADDGFTMRIAPAPMPANDDFVAARTVKVPGRYEGSLIDATDELGEPSHVGSRPQRSVWYRFKARRTGRLSIQASSDGCNPTVAVYTGTRLSALRRRAGAVNSRTVRFRARRGQTYRLAVDCGYRALQGFELTISDGSIAGKGVTIEPVAGQTVQSVIERGLRTIVKAKRKTTVRIELLLSQATARELGLERRVIGSVRGTLGYRQSLPATIRLSDAAREAIDGRETLSAALRVTLLGTDAPSRVLTVPVSLPN
jgi:hypothetical protein